MKKVFLIMIILNIFTLYTSFYQNNLDENYIYVEIKGEVKKEGVYKLKENSRVEDLIKIAKLKNSADTKFNNLSKKLHDEDVVIIYSKEGYHSFF